MQALCFRRVRLLSRGRHYPLDLVPPLPRGTDLLAVSLQGRAAVVLCACARRHQPSRGFRSLLCFGWVWFWRRGTCFRVSLSLCTAAVLCSLQPAPSGLVCCTPPSVPQSLLDPEYEVRRRRRGQSRHFFLRRKQKKGTRLTIIIGVWVWLYCFELMGFLPALRPADQATGILISVFPCVRPINRHPPPIHLFAVAPPHVPIAVRLLPRTLPVGGCPLGPLPG